MRRLVRQKCVEKGLVSGRSLPDVALTVVTVVVVAVVVVALLVL